MGFPNLSPYLGVAGLSISIANVGFTLNRIHVEKISRANRLRFEYGKDVAPRMAFFTRYKNNSEQARNMSYTAAFQAHDCDDDIKAEENRSLLTGWWGGVIEDHKHGLLPSDLFASDNGLWLQRASNYLELVEPIDIANYARLKFEIGSGPYLSGNNRPSQYVYIENLTRSQHKKKAGD